MAKKPLDPNPAPERGVYFTAPDGRIVKASRSLALKEGWHVTTAEEFAAAALKEKERAERERLAAAGASTKKGG